MKREDVLKNLTWTEHVFNSNRDDDDDDDEVMWCDDDDNNNINNTHRYIELEISATWKWVSLHCARTLD